MEQFILAFPEPPLCNLVQLTPDEWLARGWRAKRAKLEAAKQQTTVETVDPNSEDESTARQCISLLLVNSHNIADVCALVRNNDDTFGVVSSIQGAAENLMFIKQVEQKIIAGEVGGGSEAPEPETA